VQRLTLPPSPHLFPYHHIAQVPPGACWFGGVPPAAWAAAPALPEVVGQLQQLCGGRLLLGHGLAKDMAALGMRHPQHLLFDTMTHAAFCNKVGCCWRVLWQCMQIALP
jgi:DNA polymerase III epsilon subunit-like protein